MRTAWEWPCAGEDGKMHLLTGNQIGSLLAWYRCMSMSDLGIINDSNRSRAVMVKTFVTTGLQDAIGHHFGYEVVNVLTGFKYIAQKLGKYEQAIPAEKREGYRKMSEEQTRALRLEYSRYFVFGGEESYGYLAQDFVRDKDANSAAIIFAELAAYAESIGKSLLELLHELFEQFGVYLEMGKSLVMEGADGAARIAALAASYSSNPPTEVDGRSRQRHPGLFQGRHGGCGRRSYSGGKNDFRRSGGRPQFCGAALRNGTQD